MTASAARRARAAACVVGGHPMAAHGLIGGTLAIFAFVPALVLVMTITECGLRVSDVEFGGAAFLALAFGGWSLRWPLAAAFTIGTFALLAYATYAGLGALSDQPVAGALGLGAACAFLAGRLVRHRTSWWALGTVLVASAVVASSHPASTVLALLPPSFLTLASALGPRRP